MIMTNLDSYKTRPLTEPVAPLSALVRLPLRLLRA